MAKSIKLKNIYWDTSGIVHGHTNLKTYLNNLILSKVYPVGAIYISVSSTSPATLFGGTWERIQGKFLLAANDSVEAYKAGKTGGSVSHTLTVNEIPAHNHSVGAHAHGLNSHTHTYDKSNTPTGKASGNTGGTAITVDQMPSHNHAIGNYNESGVQLSHSRFLPVAGGDGKGWIDNICTDWIGGGKTHTHTLNSHTHTIGVTSTNSGASSGNTANSTAFNSGNKGGGEAHSIMPPFLSVYVWKRTA